MGFQEKKVTHICLLGDDPSANLTPLADTAIESQRLIICYSQAQNQAMQSLSYLAKTRGLEVDTWLLPQNADTENLKLSFIQLIESELANPAIKKSPLEICLNASNGTRQQVLCAYEVVRSYQLPIYIVDPQLDKICWLYPEGRSAVEITDTIKLHEFFILNDCNFLFTK